LLAGVELAVAAVLLAEALADAAAPLLEAEARLAAALPEAEAALLDVEALPEVAADRTRRGWMAPKTINPPATKAAEKRKKG